MKIAILGWGSLIWLPKDLKFDTNSGWKENGPVLPIEFARISKDGRLTLVITPNGTEVPTLYAVMSRRGERNKEEKLRKSFTFFDKPVSKE